MNRKAVLFLAAIVFAGSQAFAADLVVIYVQQGLGNGQNGPVANANVTIMQMPKLVIGPVKPIVITGQTDANGAFTTQIDFTKGDAFASATKNGSSTGPQGVQKGLNTLTLPYLFIEPIRP